MEASKAKLYLIGLKKQVRQRELYEALDVAIEALAWKEAEENLEESRRIKLLENK